MKKFAQFLCLALCSMLGLASCSNEDEIVESHPMKLHVKIKGLNIFQEEFAETRSTASEAGVSYIEFAVFDSKEQKVFEKNQKSGDDDFGEIECILRSEKYHLVAVAHKGNSSYGNATIVSPYRVELPSTSIQETFSVVKELDLTSASGTGTTDVEIQINRVTSLLQIKSTEKQPSEVSKIRLTIGDASKSAYTTCFFNPSNGFMSNFGTDGFYTMTKSIAHFADSYTDCMFDLLLPTSPCTMPVKIEILDANDVVLDSYEIDNVSFQTNRRTVATGSMYGVTWNGCLQFNIGWDTEWNITF